MLLSALPNLGECTRGCTLVPFLENSVVRMIVLVLNDLGSACFEMQACFCQTLILRHKCMQQFLLELLIGVRNTRQDDICAWN